MLRRHPREMGELGDRGRAGGGAQQLGKLHPVEPFAQGEDIEIKILQRTDRKSTRLNSSHANISYAVFCLKKKTQWQNLSAIPGSPPWRVSRTHTRTDH